MWTSKEPVDPHVLLFGQSIGCLTDGHPHYESLFGRSVEVDDVTIYTSGGVKIIDTVLAQQSRALSVSTCGGYEDLQVVLVARNEMWGNLTFMCASSDRWWMVINVRFLTDY